jgi:hypothetical protein
MGESIKPMSSADKEGFRRRGYTKLMNWYRETPVYIPLLNESARTMLRGKIAWDRARVTRYCAGRESEIEEWFEGLKLFFGFSSIRGGTVFLSNMLKIEVPDSHIEHEANLDDYWNLAKVMQDETEALTYMRDFRKYEIFCRARNNIEVYGEVNPMIRLHCGAIKEVFPKARLFHMVRDPRNVLRSIMGKENLGNKDPMSKVIFPPPNDPYHEKWAGMSRFERVCWEWQFDNRFMRERIPHLTRFEQMMGDYGYFKEKFVDFLDIELTESTWSSYVHRPRNATRKYRFPHWKQWDSEMLDTLDRICGEEMAHYGYSV